MGDLNIGTASANNSPNIAAQAISAELFQDGVLGSDYMLKQQTNKARALRCDRMETRSDSGEGIHPNIHRTDVVTQITPNGISNKMREVFGSRLRAVIASNVGYFTSITEFLGEVRSVDLVERVFLADVSNSKNTDECYAAEFDLDEISSSDLDLVQPGALFFWLVGREISNGTERNISQIRFRRMASISKRQLLRIEHSVREETESIRHAIVED